jgi:hypothetical protein
MYFLNGVSSQLSRGETLILSEYRAISREMSLSLFLFDRSK